MKKEKLNDDKKPRLTMEENNESLNKEIDAEIKTFNEVLDHPKKINVQRDFGLREDKILKEWEDTERWKKAVVILNRAIKYVKGYLWDYSINFTKDYHKNPAEIRISVFWKREEEEEKEKRNRIEIEMSEL